MIWHLKTTLTSERLIRKAALLNAVSHDGKAQAGAIVGKILGERADLRSKVKELSAVINTLQMKLTAYQLQSKKQLLRKNGLKPKRKKKLKKNGCRHCQTPTNTSRLLRGFLLTLTAYCIWVQQEPSCLATSTPACTTANSSCALKTPTPK